MTKNIQSDVKGVLEALRLCSGDDFIVFRIFLKLASTLKFFTLLKSVLLIVLLGLTTFEYSFAFKVKVTGRAFFDNNANHIFDNGDSKLVNGSVTIENKDSLYNITVYTDTNGAYSAEVPNGTSSFGIYNSDQVNYKFLGTVFKTYTSEQVDTVDFAFQRKDSVESTYCVIYNSVPSHATIPNGANTETFSLVYSYTGFIHPLNAQLQLDFNPLVSFVSSSLAPDKIDPGHVEWNLTNVERGTHSISVILSFISVGDTIDGFDLQPTFTLQDDLGAHAKISNVRNRQYIKHDYSNHSSGRTKGLKWSRAFANLKGYSMLDVDTSNDKNYLAVGIKRTASLYDPIIFKIDSNGFSVREISLSDVGYEWRSYAISKIKSTVDGGFVTLGYINNPGKQLRLCKYNSEGYPVWWRDCGIVYDSRELNCDLQITSSGYIICGTASDKVDEVVEVSIDTLKNKVFVASISSLGDLQWKRKYGGSRNDEVLKVFSLKDGTFIISAITESENGDVNFAHNHAFSGFYNNDSTFSKEAWLFNISPGGEILWSHCYGGSGQSSITGFVEQPDGLLFTGFTDSKNGDATNNLTSFSPLWILKVTPDGKLIWSKAHQLYAGYKNENLLTSEFYGYGAITSLKTMNDGTYLVGLRTRDQYGYLRASHSEVDILLVKFDTAGSITGQRAIGGNNHDYLYAIQIDKGENIIFVGETLSENDDLYARLPDKRYYYMFMGKIGQANFLQGNVFIDQNRNYQFDGGEPYFSEGLIRMENAKATTYTPIFDGRYFIIADTGSYTLSYWSQKSYFDPYPGSRIISLKTYDQDSSISFALQPKTNIHDLQTAIIATTPSRPGFNASLRVVTKNVGTTDIANAVIKFSKPATVSYLNSKRTTTVVTADTVTFSAVSLSAGAIDTLDINVKLATPPTINNGDTLTFTAIALPQATDTTPVDNVATVNEVVRGSFDPNDKTEAHAGVYTPTMQSNGEPFQYLIRFQNTGTDTAFYVTVKDTLDSRVNINTLETISSSHPYTFSMEGNIATWQFNMLRLVNSSINEPKSHGYISFSILPKDDLKIGDSVLNKAAIYFDYNLPVITNSSKLLLVSDQSILCAGGSTQLKAGFAGAAYQWQVNTGNGFTNISNNAVYNGANTPTLLLSNLPSSYYGYKYHCIIMLEGNSKVYSNTYKLTFVNNWTGATSTAWETASNWSCGSVPDSNTDVIIKSTSIRQPEVSSVTASCRSVNANTGAHVWIKAGAKLNVIGK